MHCSDILKEPAIGNLIDSSSLWIHHQVHKKAMFLWPAPNQWLSMAGVLVIAHSLHYRTLPTDILCLGTSHSWPKLSELHCPLKPFSTQFFLLSVLRCQTCIGLTTSLPTPASFPFIFSSSSHPQPSHKSLANLVLLLAAQKSLTDIFCLL